MDENDLATVLVIDYDADLISPYRGETANLGPPQNAFDFPGSPTTF